MPRLNALRHIFFVFAVFASIHCEAADLSCLDPLTESTVRDPVKRNGLNAVLAGDIHGLKKYLSQGGSPNERFDGAESLTMLMKASACGHEELIPGLLSHHADVRATGWFYIDATHKATNVTALSLAAYSASGRTIGLLLKSGADPNEQPQICTASEGDTQVCVNGRSPLMIAAGRAEVVKALLRAGADADRTDGDGRRAIDYAREIGARDSIRILDATKHH